MSADLLTPAELGELLGGAPHRTVLDWRRLYKWECVQIGGRFFFTPEQVDAIIRKHTVAGGKLAPTDGRTAKSASRGKR